MNYVGSASLPYINLRDASYFAKYLPGAPPVNFAAQFFGILKVHVCVCMCLFMCVCIYIYIYI